MNIRILTLVCVAAVLVSLGTLVDRAAAVGTIVASDYVGGGTVNTYPNATGWWFSPKQNITVTHLGLYDIGAPGFQSSHDVGIFSDNGTPLVTTMVPAGVSGTLVPGTIDGTRVLPVPATTLQAGSVYYTVSNHFEIDPYVFGMGAVTHASQLNWLGFADSGSGNIFGPISNHGGLPGNTGPNFLFVIPEPAAVTILLIGAAAIAVWSRRRRHGDSIP